MDVTVDGSGALSHMDLSLPHSKGIVIGFWIATALFCLPIGFTSVLWGLSYFFWRRLEACLDEAPKERSRAMPASA